MMGQILTLSKAFLTKPEQAFSGKLNRVALTTSKQVFHVKRFLFGNSNLEDCVDKGSNNSSFKEKPQFVVPNSN